MLIKQLKGEFVMKTICWFDYKTVIITGASSGIGKGLTERLIKDHNLRQDQHVALIKCRQLFEIIPSL